MHFGIMFFASAAQAGETDRYRLLKEAARFADAHGFTAIWTPERHFSDFGGLFPNPSVLSAALAMITSRIQLRAGSVISPLHNPIRIAEEWSLVDNLSNGRVAISVGSGWNIDDFVFFPERYADRHRVMYEQIRTVRELWSGRPFESTNAAGKTVTLRMMPPPVQPELPIWVTSSGNTETFASAGAIGANLLTHLLGQDLATLAVKIGAYRDARCRNCHDPAAGIVTLMLHTYVGPDLGEVRDRVRAPLREYLRSAVAIETAAARGGGVMSGGRRMENEQLAPQDEEELLDLAFERYFNTSALLGTPSSCREMVRKAESCGVNEIACLLDFGLPAAQVLDGLAWLDRLRAACAADATAVAPAVEAFSAEF